MFGKIHGFDTCFLREEKCGKKDERRNCHFFLILCVFIVRFTISFSSSFSTYGSRHTVLIGFCSASISCSMLLQILRKKSYADIRASDGFRVDRIVRTSIVSRYVTSSSFSGSFVANMFDDSTFKSIGLTSGAGLQEMTGCEFILTIFYVFFL